MCAGHEVCVVDNLFSGSKSTIAHWMSVPPCWLELSSCSDSGHLNFEFVRADVVHNLAIECDQIYHLACPASPKFYRSNEIRTLKTSFVGCVSSPRASRSHPPSVRPADLRRTMNMLGLAKRVKARFLLASTSEIYGSPLEHPQTEDYWGNVNPTGPRSCYDEGKRVAESLTYGYQRQERVDVRVARIFNCYGPRMDSDDGRLVSNFIVAAIRGEPLKIYGTGSHTRSLMCALSCAQGLS